MNKRNKIAFRIMVGILVAVLIALCCYNLKTNDKFLEASLTTYISIVVAIGISYFLSQRQTDKRKQKDVLLNLIYRIQSIIYEKEAYKINETTDLSLLHMRSRDISNGLQLLDKYGKDFCIEKDTKFLIEKFNEYELLIGD
ncbi:MAG: hypothetical protein AAGU75_14005, partial [Bacillota bacterium]